MHVILKHKNTGELKELNIGWSWSLLFLSSLFGLPLFLRNLNFHGTCLLVLSVMAYLADWSALLPASSEGLQVVQGLIALATVLYSFFMALRGNRLTGINMLANGWEFCELDRTGAEHARGKWQLDTASA